MLNLNIHKNEFVTRVKFSSPIFQPPLSINEIFTENMRHIGTYFSHMQVRVLS